MDKFYASQLRAKCPRSGGDQNLFFLDFVSPTKFDNNYFKNLLASKGLLNSDQVLVTKSQASLNLVKKYAENTELFFEQFAKSMVKMGNISPLTGVKGEIRKNCRKINSTWVEYPTVHGINKMLCLYLCVFHSNIYYDFLMFFLCLWRNNCFKFVSSVIGPVVECKRILCYRKFCVTITELDLTKWPSRLSVKQIGPSSFNWLEQTVV